MTKKFVCPDYQCECPLGLREIDNATCSRCWIIPSEKHFIENGGLHATIILGNNTAPLTERTENIAESGKSRYFRVFLGEKKP